MVKSARGARPPASAEWARAAAPIDRSGEFPYVSHLSGSLEAAGRDRSLKYSRTRAGLGGWAGPGSVASTLGRRRAGRGIDAPAHLLWRDITLFSSELRPTPRLTTVRQTLVPLPRGALLMPISCFKPAPCTDAPRTPLDAPKAQISLPLTLERQWHAPAGSCATLSHGAAKNVTASRSKCLNLRRCQREDGPGSRAAGGAAGLANTHQKRTGDLRSVLMSCRGD
jgi:hypothetical protein